MTFSLRTPRLLLREWRDSDREQFAAMSVDPALLAGRSPYFHNGSALEIDDLINFYDQRFQIGLTPQEKSDLAAFLETL